MFAEDVTIEKLYKDGYTVGYDWMNRDKHPPNFKHPSVPHGYIPGGPVIFVRANSWDKNYKEMNLKADKLHTAWTKGFIDGINNYVKKHDLPFPQIAQRE